MFKKRSNNDQKRKDSVDTLKFDISKMPTHMKILKKNEHPAYNKYDNNIDMKLENNKKDTVQVDTYDLFLEIINDYTERHTERERDTGKLSRPLSTKSIVSSAMSNIFKEKYSNELMWQDSYIEDSYMENSYIESRPLSIESTSSSVISNIFKEKYNKAKQE
jgi:hypothetical protein